MSAATSVVTCSSRLASGFHGFCSFAQCTQLLPYLFLHLPDPEPYERTEEGPAVYGVAPSLLRRKERHREVGRGSGLRYRNASRSRFDSIAYPSEVAELHLSPSVDAADHRVSYSSPRPPVSLSTLGQEVDRVLGVAQHLKRLRAATTSLFFLHR